MACFLLVFDSAHCTYKPHSYKEKNALNLKENKQYNIYHIKCSSQCISVLHTHSSRSPVFHSPLGRKRKRNVLLYFIHLYIVFCAQIHINCTCELLAGKLVNLSLLSYGQTERKLRHFCLRCCFCVHSSFVFIIIF